MQSELHSRHCFREGETEIDSKENYTGYKEEAFYSEGDEALA